jgi:hypothetical protein
MNISYAPILSSIIPEKRRNTRTVLQSIGVATMAMIGLSSFNNEGSQLYDTSRTDPIKISQSSWHTLIEQKVGEPLYRSPDGLYQEYATKNPNLFIISMKNGDIQLIRKFPGGHAILFIAEKPK